MEIVQEVSIVSDETRKMFECTDCHVIFKLAHLRVSTYASTVCYLPGLFRVEMLLCGL